MGPYEVISDIYQFLEDVDEDTLHSAMSQNLPPELVAVLRALIAARRALDREMARNRQIGAIRLEDGSKRGKGSDDQSDIDLLHALELGDSESRLNRPQRSADAARSDAMALMRILSESGLPSRGMWDVLRASGMDIPDVRTSSRRDVVLQAGRALLERPSKHRTSILSRVRRILKSGETEGWMKLIHPRHQR